MRNINNETYVKILEKLTSIDNYFLLSQLADNQSLPRHIKIDGYLNLLQKREYINQNGQLTEKAVETLAYINNDTVVLKQVEEKSQSFGEFCTELHKKLQDKLIELTGKKQKLINGKYSFLCNLVDLKSKLSKVITKYNLTQNDYIKIEKALINHIIKSYNNKFEYAQLLEYYILKDNNSRLVTDLENIEEEKEIENTVEYTSTQKFI